MNAKLNRRGIPSDVRAAVERWLDTPRYAAERPQLARLVARADQREASARDELTDAFTGSLPIGTGGRRGCCGPGPNRINSVVMRETVSGLGTAMVARGLTPHVAVVYDTRRDSAYFARVVAAQLAAEGHSVSLVCAPRPTPQLSFIVRRAGCGAGVVISASHNPPQDNGIKLYGPDGGQVVGAWADEVVAAIEGAATGGLADLHTECLVSDAALVSAYANIRRIDPTASTDLGDATYHSYVLEQGVVSGSLAESGLAVAFTPLHGVGHWAVEPVLSARGVRVHLVEAQCDPDGGRFSTVSSANPEVPASMEHAIALADEHGADLVLATDPDADRLGACARDGAGELRAIDGNRLGALMLAHILAHLSPDHGGWVLTTQVTTPLVAAIARAHECEWVDDLLVGFKNHCAMMLEQPERTLIFACEESHGYLRGEGVRDKDAAIASLLLCECAALAKLEGKTLFDRLDALWERYGYHRERTANLVAGGQAGKRAIVAVMDHFRSRRPVQLGGLKVVRYEDRLEARHTGSPTRDLPANVLVLELEAGDAACRVALRPSGTEPKLKIYALGRRAPSGDLAADRERVDAMVEQVLTATATLAEATMAPVLAV
ncbi:MAG: phospho-sugar mutase [Nannocystaceae bacterium]